MLAVSLCQSRKRADKCLSLLVRISSATQLVRANVRRLPRSLLKNRKEVDRVRHLAAVTSIQESVMDPLFTTEVNVTGTLNVLESAKALKAERVVFAS